MGRIGIVSFSYALSKTERMKPNLCNEKLADETARLDSSNFVERVVVQWEVGIALEEIGFAPHLVVEANEDKSYLDSRGVWEQAKADFDEHGVDRVIVVAQPFLQLGHVKRMIRKDNFTVVNEKVRRIGFFNDDLNTQPWTKGPLRQLVYAVRVRLLKKHGNKEQKVITST